MKKWVKILLIVLLAVVLLAAAYVAYVFISYHRIGDQPLTPVQTPDTAPSLSAGEAYTMVSWNIGFGAYEEDYGFFMDGGTESRAWSKERLTANMDAIAGYLKQQDADFFFQRRQLLFDLIIFGFCHLAHFFIQLGIIHHRLVIAHNLQLVLIMANRFHYWFQRG